jgi:hypothetical protein
VLAALAVALTVVVAIIAAGTTPRSTATPGAPSATAVGPSALAISIDCRRESGPMPAYLAGDPCPSAIVAVELAVAPVRLPIERMVIVSGPLFCDVIWEGVGSPAVCFGPAIRPGQFMHAYVRFDGSSRVAVVMLGLDLPADDNDPFATRPPWNSTLIAVEVPPAGWVMP